MKLDLDSFAKITHHEGAIVCSYETVLDLPLDAVEPQMIRLMEAVQNHIEQQNGLVGHIKAHSEESGRTLTFSAAGSKVTILSGPGVQTSVSFTAIAFSVDDKKLQLLVEDLFHGIS